MHGTNTWGNTKTTKTKRLQKKGFASWLYIYTGSLHVILTVQDLTLYTRLTSNSKIPTASAFQVLGLEPYSTTPR